MRSVFAFAILACGKIPDFMGFLRGVIREWRFRGQMRDQIPIYGR